MAAVVGIFAQSYLQALSWMFILRFCRPFFCLFYIYLYNALSVNDFYTVLKLKC